MSFPLAFSNCTEINIEPWEKEKTLWKLTSRIEPDHITNILSIFVNTLSIFINMLSILVNMLSIFINMLSILVKTLSIFINMLSIFINMLSIFLSVLSLFVNKLNIFINMLPVQVDVMLCTRAHATLGKFVRWRLILSDKLIVWRLMALWKSTLQVHFGEKKTPIYLMKSFSVFKFSE